MLCLCAYEAYRARTLATEFQETEHILNALLIAGGVFCIGMPVYALNTANLDIRLFIFSVIIFACCNIILFVMFLPKIRYKENNEPRTIISGVTVSGANAINVGASGVSFSGGERILSNKTRKELLSEIATLRQEVRRLRVSDEEQDGRTEVPDETAT